MTSKKGLTKKQLNHLLTIGTLALSNQGLIDLTEKLREKYRINLIEAESNPDGYIDRLQKKGTFDKIKAEVEEQFTQQQAEDEGMGKLEQAFANTVNQERHEKAKDVWKKHWPLMAENIYRTIETLMEDMTLDQFLKKYGLNYLAGGLFVDEFTKYVLTDELQAMPLDYTGMVITQMPDRVVAIAGPLSIQEDILSKFKKAMRDKFPASSRSLSDRIGAACLAYHKIGLTDKEIVLKIYDLDPNRKDFDRELSRLEILIRKKRERIKEQKDKRL